MSISRTKRKEKRNQQQNNQLNLNLREITPLTDNQQEVFNFYPKYDMLLHGAPGTGKTFLAFYLSLTDILVHNYYKKLYVIRSMQPGKQAGFLPGSLKEKAAVYEEPYVGICSDLFQRGDAYEYLKQKNIIEFKTTSYLRGITLDDCVVIVDEFQNATAQELHTLITRVGENCKLIISGDIFQDDLTSERMKEKSGAKDLIKVLNGLDEFKSVEFSFDDVVRSDFVKRYLMRRHKLEQTGHIEALV